jgi:hypothetical protein
MTTKAKPFKLNVSAGVSAMIAAESAIKLSGRPAVSQMANRLCESFGTKPLAKEIEAEAIDGIERAKRHDWKTPGSIKNGRSRHLAIIRARVGIRELLACKAFQPDNYYWGTVYHWSVILNSDKVNGSVTKTRAVLKAEAATASKPVRHTANRDVEAVTKMCKRMLALPKLSPAMLKALRKFCVDFELDVGSALQA